MERLNLPNFSLMQGLVLPIAFIGIYVCSSLMVMASANLGVSILDLSSIVCSSILLHNTQDLS